MDQILKSLERCEKHKNQILINSATIQFLFQKLASENCVIPSIKCMSGPSPTQSSNFSPSTNSINLYPTNSRMQTESSITHELIHAYDNCTVNINWRNPHHLMCSEIRAIMLSGECNFLKEVGRGRVGFAKQFQKCIKRRALMSGNSSVFQGADAEEVLIDVWPSCFGDSAPFDEIP